MRIYHSSPIFSNASSHIIDGNIPVHISDDLKVNFNIKEIEFLCYGELKGEVDFKEWREQSLGFKTSVFQKDMKTKILSSLEVSDIFFYDSEYNVLSINESAIQNNIRHILSNWKRKLSENITSLKEEHARIYAEVESKNMGISIMDNTLELSKSTYLLKIENKQELINLLNDHIKKYYSESITFLKERSTSNHKISLEEIENQLDQLMKRSNPSVLHILEFVKWICNSFKVEPENDS
jgi:hypothetical protein